MAYIQRPTSQKTDSLGKATAVASLAAMAAGAGGGGGGAASSGGGAVTTSSGLSGAKTGLQALGAFQNIKALQNEPAQIEQQKPSALARRYEAQAINPQETLNILKAGEQAINYLGRQDPQVFEQYYKPLADTMFAVYKDPKYQQFINQNRTQQG